MFKFKEINEIFPRGSQVLLNAGDSVVTLSVLGELFKRKQLAVVDICLKFVKFKFIFLPGSAKHYSLFTV